MNKDKQVLAANEIYRVLKNGGRAYIEVPNKFQLIDEHNKVLFGTYLPPLLRKIYTKRVSKNKSYVQCWERSGKGWRSLFQDCGLATEVFGYAYRKKWLPPNRFKIYIRKNN